MSAYQSRQLTVILCILTATFLYAITRLYRAQAANNSSAGPAPAAVYEIRGDVMQEGFYCFTQEQRASVLLQAAGGLTGINLLPEDRADSAILKSGKRIVLKTILFPLLIIAESPPSSGRKFLPVSPPAACSKTDVRCS